MILFTQDKDEYAVGQVLKIRIVPHNPPDHKSKRKPTWRFFKVERIIPYSGPGNSGSYEVHLKESHEDKGEQR